jgi:hypothetical protein
VWSISLEVVLVFGGLVGFGIGGGGELTLGD